MRRFSKEWDTHDLVARSTVEELLFDLSVGHAVDLTHYSNDVVRKALGTLREADFAMMVSLQANLVGIPAEFTVRRLEEALTEAKGINQLAVDRFSLDLHQEMMEFVGVESQFYYKMGKAAVPEWNPIGIDSQQAYAGALARPFQGRLLSEWARGVEFNRMARVRDTLRIGFVEGKTVDQMVRSLRGTRAAGYADGILSIETRNAEAVVRTAIQHFAAYTREKFYDANSDMIEGKVWVSTLDTRTTEQCQIRDGLQYTPDNKPVGHKIPWLAGPGQLHWCCRSCSIPIIKDFEKLGLRQREGTRASQGGPVPRGTTYLEWLKAQSAERQDEVLGPVRGEMFRSGKAEMGRFWNDKGIFLTLDELRSRNSSPVQ